MSFYTGSVQTPQGPEIHLIDADDLRPACRQHIPGDQEPELLSERPGGTQLTCAECRRFYDRVESQLPDLARIEKRLKTISDDIAQRRKQIERLAQEREHLGREAQRIKYPQQLTTMQGVMDGNGIVIGNGPQSRQAQAVMNAWIADHPGLYQSGVREIGKGDHQFMLSIKLDRNHPLSEQMGVRDALPMIREDAQRRRVFAIFEHSLSRDGSFYLIVHPDETCQVTCNEHPIFSGPLDDAMRYIYDHHPYQFKRSEHDDD